MIGFEEFYQWFLSNILWMLLGLLIAELIFVILIQVLSLFNKLGRFISQLSGYFFCKFSHGSDWLV